MVFMYGWEKSALVDRLYRVDALVGTTLANIDSIILANIQA